MRRPRPRSLIALPASAMHAVGTVAFPRQRRRAGAAPVLPGGNSPGRRRPDDDERGPGTAGVREPRRPKPGPPAATMARDEAGDPVGV